MDAMTRVDSYLAHVATTRAALPARVRHLVGDGFYSKLRRVDGVLALGLDVIGKLRCDASLQYVYEGAQKAFPMGNRPPTNAAPKQSPEQKGSENTCQEPDYKFAVH